MLIIRVSENMPLYDILNEFQKGHSHIAVVIKDLNQPKEVKYVESKLKRKKRKVPSDKTVQLAGDDYELLYFSLVHYIKFSFFFILNR